jgi:type I restriction enzyme M protein
MTGRQRGRVNSTEVDAYIFIKNNLKEIGWDTRSPDRAPTGQVYTQNECLNHPEIHSRLVRDQPENIVKISESIFWVIEAKREHNKLDQAVDEAEGYAQKINSSPIIKALFVSGVAGNEGDSYLIKTRFFNGQVYAPVTLNGVELSGFLTPSQIETILHTSNPNIADVQIDDKLFISKAEEINEILHLGAVNPHKRASVMAAILLSMLDSTQPNIDAAPSVLISEINARVQRILRNEGKPEFYEYIKLDLPATEDNHIKFKSAIVSTIQELNLLNIRSAMNSGADVLGKFYEVFLKYANWAQDLGIVLTPRHITQFAAEVSNISSRDIVFDPCCGTGGFLVAAFDYIKRNSQDGQIDNFKRNSLFGIEQDAGVASLAIVNMIFRGDGKNNIIEGNCLVKNLESTTRGGCKLQNISHLTQPGHLLLEY